LFQANLLKIVKKVALAVIGILAALFVASLLPPDEVSSWSYVGLALVFLVIYTVDYWIPWLVAAHSKRTKVIRLFEQEKLSVSLPELLIIPVGQLESATTPSSHLFKLRVQNTTKRSIDKVKLVIDKIDAMGEIEMVGAERQGLETVRELPLERTTVSNWEGPGEEEHHIPPKEHLDFNFIYASTKAFALCHTHKRSLTSQDGRHTLWNRTPEAKFPSGKYEIVVKVVGLNTETQRKSFLYSHVEGSAQLQEVSS